MFKAVVMTAFERPQYLSRVLRALAENDLAGYELFIGLEPGNPEVERLCKGVRFMPCTVLANPKRLGVRENPFQTFERAFQWADACIYIEDDLVISPDVCALANWYFRHPHRDSYVSLNLFNYQSDPRHPGMLKVYSGGEHPMRFSPLGFCISRGNWETHFRPYWNAHPLGWDYSVVEHFAASGARGLLPAFSRSMHIGREGGEHCSPARHDKLFGGVRWNMDKGPYAYKIGH